MEKIQLLIAIALASAAISYTITSGSVISWLRAIIEPIHPKASQLINCPWCLSHYPTIIILIIAAIVRGVYHVSIDFVGIWWFDFLFTWFVIQGIVGVIHYFIAFYNGANGSFRRGLERAQKNPPTEYLKIRAEVDALPEEQRNTSQVSLYYRAVSGCSTDLIRIYRDVPVGSDWEGTKKNGWWKKKIQTLFYDNQIVTELWPTDSRAD